MSKCNLNVVIVIRFNTVIDRTLPLLDPLVGNSSHLLKHHPVYPKHPFNTSCYNWNKLTQKVNFFVDDVE